MNICPIVLNYNTHRETIECVKSILSGNYVPSTIIIVDNDSTDLSVSHIEHYLSSFSRRTPICVNLNDINCGSCYSYGGGSIYLLESKSNAGYACGNLVGITFSRSLTTDIDYYWLLNSDTSLKNNSFFNLNKFLSVNQKFDLLGTVILDSISNKIQSCGGYFNIYTGRAEHVMEGESVEDIVAESGVKWATYPVGASMIVSKKLSGIDNWIRKDLFLYYEEINIVISCGKPYIVPILTNVFVEHKCGASTGFSREPTKRPPLLEYYLYRNKLLTAHSLGGLFVISYLLFSFVGLLKRLPMYNRLQFKYAILGIYHGILKKSDQIYRSSK